jgi:hypothetical protein
MAEEHDGHPSKVQTVPGYHLPAGDSKGATAMLIPDYCVVFNTGARLSVTGPGIVTREGSVWSHSDG